MTFFLANKTTLKNLKLTFNNCGINIDRIILKSFADGISYSLKNKNDTNFTTIALQNKRINISIFKNKSYIFTQDFDFGTDLIIKDISKLCSLKFEEVNLLLKEVNLKAVLENDIESYLDKKFFSMSPYRKIKHQLILDIITSRLEELVEICYERNINIKYFKKSDGVIYITIETFEYFKNIQFALQKNKLIDTECLFGKNIEDSSLFTLNGTAVLIAKGWEKEAIPFIQSKKSIISTFFSRLFS